MNYYNENGKEKRRKKRKENKSNKRRRIHKKMSKQYNIDIKSNNNRLQ